MHLKVTLFKRPIPIFVLTNNVHVIIDTLVIRIYFDSVCQNEMLL